MKRLLALSLAAACMLVSACSRSYNTNSSAYQSRRYSTYRTPSTRHHEHRSGGGSHHRGGGGGGSHHHHHDGDRNKGRH